MTLYYFQGRLQCIENSISFRMVTKLRKWTKWTEALVILNCKRLNATVLNHNISVNIQRYIISTLTPAVLNTVCSCHTSISPLSFPAKGPYIEKRVGWQSFANLLGTQNISSPSWKISSNILLHWNVKFSILNRYLWWLIW